MDFGAQSESLLRAVGCELESWGSWESWGFWGFWGLRVAGLGRLWALLRVCVHG